MKIRTHEDSARFMAALRPVDQAFFASEQKYGVGRLERLVSPATFAAYQRGWDAYRVALDEADAEALELIGPKMIAALAFMDAEATAAGHQPLAPDTWEISMGDCRVLVVVRTNAEAAAVLRASRPAQAETAIPPDLAITVRSQHEGRALTVITMAEVARLLLMAEGKVSGQPWEGTPAHTGVQRDEMMAHDLARQGYPLQAPLATETPTAKPLDF